MYFFLICRGEAQTRELYVTIIYFLSDVELQRFYSLCYSFEEKSNLIFQKSNQVFKKVIKFSKR